jgi:hypothetical protein
MVRIVASERAEQDALKLDVDALVRDGVNLALSRAAKAPPEGYGLDPGLVRRHGGQCRGAALAPRRAPGCSVNSIPDSGLARESLFSSEARMGHANGCAQVVRTACS